MDIIALDGDTVVFVEVKARRTRGYSPKAAVTRSKQRKISIAALYYLKTNGLLNAKARFDNNKAPYLPFSKPFRKQWTQMIWKTRTVV